MFDVQTKQAVSVTWGDTKQNVGGGWVKLNSKAEGPVPSAFVRALQGMRSEWVHIGVFSSAVNLLMLTGSIYMLQVYDRVLSSRSLSTLAALSAIVMGAYILQGALDGIRQKMLGRLATSFDQVLSPLTARAAVILPARGAKPQEALQPMRDLDTLRTFLSSLGPTALLDMPFMPVFLAGSFILHPWLGWLAVAGAVIVIGLTIWTEKVSSAPSKALATSGAQRLIFAEAGRRNAEAVQAMGMTTVFAERYAAIHKRYMTDHLGLAEKTSRISGAAKIVRYVLQSAVLGVGAWLVIRGELSGGAMIAASILTSRALAPVETAVAHWKAFVAARQAYHRLRQALPLVEATTKSLDLPLPKKSLDLQDVLVCAPLTNIPIVQGVTFHVRAGQAVGLIGPSASGKSTLAKALTGVWTPTRGSVRLDGALLSQWAPEELGRSVGYLPQDVELFDGTIAENIARFDPYMQSETVIAAAESAGAHDLITSFPAGYDTVIGERGTALSGGQRQRVALARALYGHPFLVVLDEPNANLDAAGDEALMRAVQSVKARNGIAVVITHRPSGLSATDLVGVMANGKLQAFGPRDEVMARSLRPAPVTIVPPPVSAPHDAHSGNVTQMGSVVR